MALTNLDADPKGGTALTRDDIPELVKAVVKAVKAQTNPANVRTGPVNVCESSCPGRPCSCIKVYLLAVVGLQN